MARVVSTKGVRKRCAKRCSSASENPRWRVHQYSNMRLLRAGVELKHRATLYSIAAAAPPTMYGITFARPIVAVSCCREFCRSSLIIFVAVRNLVALSQSVSKSSAGTTVRMLASLGSCEGEADAAELAPAPPNPNPNHLDDAFLFASSSATFRCCSSAKAAKLTNPLSVRTCPLRGHGGRSRQFVPPRLLAADSEERVRAKATFEAIAPAREAPPSAEGGTAAAEAEAER